MGMHHSCHASERAASQEPSTLALSLTSSQDQTILRGGNNMIVNIEIARMLLQALPSSASSWEATSSPPGSRGWGSPPSSRRSSLARRRTSSPSRPSTRCSTPARRWPTSRSTRRPRSVPCRQKTPTEDVETAAGVEPGTWNQLSSSWNAHSLLTPSACISTASDWLCCQVVAYSLIHCLHLKGKLFCYGQLVTCTSLCQPWLNQTRNCRL